MSDWFDDGLKHVRLPNGRTLAVEHTEGCRIVLAEGKTLVDGDAARGTAVHGRNHPCIRAAIEAQAARLPQAASDGLLHEQAASLAARLCAMLPGRMERVVFSRSVSLDAARQMAVRFWASRGEATRTRLLTFNGAALRAPDAAVIDLPRDEKTTAGFEACLGHHAGVLAAIVVEPMVQGMAGMVFHDEDTLKRVAIAAGKYGLLLVLDETFTGFGRTGAMFACEAAGVVPDIMMIGGALTGATLPLAATAASGRVCGGFPSGDFAFAGEPDASACAAADAGLDLFERERRLLEANEIGKKMAIALGRLLGAPGVTDVRVRGGIGVVQLDRIADRDALAARFAELGCWIRPWRDVVTLTPALTIGDEDLEKLTSTIVSMLGGKKPSL